MGVLDKYLYPEPPPPPEKQSGWRRAADLPLELASGVARGVKFTADAFGADNAVSSAAGAVDEYARGLLSAQAQADDQKIAAIMAEAQDAGIWEQVVAAAKAFSVAPVRTTVNALGTSVPTIAATMIPGVGQAGAAARLGMLGAMGAAQGAGVVKGSIYEAVKAEQMKQPGMTEEQADAIATEAQAYGGENTGNIAAGAALGGAASATGVQPILARMARTRGLLAEAGEAADRGILASMGLGLAKEVPLEAAQGGQEQYASNVALQREGFDVPTWRGVAGSAALEGLAAAPAGGLLGAFDRANPAEKPDPVAEPAAPPLLLGNNPEPLLSFPDGTVGTKAEVERYITSLPEKDRPAARAKLMGMGPKPSPVAQVLAAEDIDEALDAALNASRKAVGIAPFVRPIPAGEASELLPTPDVLDAVDPLPVGEVSEAIPTPDALEVEPIPTGDAFEEIPAGDAAEVLPVGETAELIPAGDAREMQRVPIATGRATELEVETIQADDLLTGDGMPYGSKVAANVRAKREGLSPANVVEIPGAGWVVRPQPTTLGTTIEATPNNTRSTNAADALRSLRDQRNMDSAPGLAAGAGDGQRADAGRGGAPVGRVPADARGQQPGTPASAAPSGAAAAPVGDGLRADAALSPESLPGRTFDMDGQRWTVAAAGKRYITIADNTGKERVISDSSVKWPAVRRALTRTETPASVDTSAGRVEEGAGSGQVTPAIRAKWPGLKGETDERIAAAEAWDKAQNRVRAAYEYRGTVESDIQDAYVEEVGQAWIAKNQTAYLRELTRRLNAEADRVQALENTPGTLESKRADRKATKRREDSAAAADKALTDDINFNIARVRELQRQGRLTPEDAERLLELARGAADKFDAAMRLEGFVSDKQLAPSDTLPVGRADAPANDPTPNAAAPAPQAPPQGRAPEVAAPEPIRAELQTAMEAAGWTAEVDSPGNAIWTKRQKGERYTALLLEPRGTRPLGMEVTVLTDGGVDVGIAELVVTAAAKAARDANQAIADSEAESAASEVESVTTPDPPTNPPAPPKQTRPERLIELRKREAVLKQLLRCLL